MLLNVGHEGKQALSECCEQIHFCLDLMFGFFISVPERRISEEARAMSQKPLAHTLLIHNRSC
jgi:hypothetical protein